MVASLDEYAFERSGAVNARPGTTIKPAVYRRYILLEALELAVVVLALLLVRSWFAIPGWLFWGLIAGWLIKDVLLFPFVWRAYDPDAPSEAGTMVGEVGIVKGKLDPSGYVQVRGELWKAKHAAGGAPIERGRPVRVLRMEGLILHVTPDDRFTPDAGEHIID